MNYISYNNTSHEVNENGQMTNRLTKQAVQDAKDAGKKAGMKAYQMKQEGASNEEISKWVHNYCIRIPNGIYNDQHARAVYVKAAREEYKNQQ